MAAKLSLAELLEASESALWRASTGSDRRRARAAAMATNDFEILALWRVRHELLMRSVAAAEGRFGQAEKLRAAGVRLVERCALVDYLHEQGITGTPRDLLITRLRGTDNPRRALLDEHRDYVLAVCSALCIDHLLRRAMDFMGPRLLRRYQALYVEQLSSVCERLLADDADPDTLDRTVPLPPEAQRLQRLLTSRTPYRPPNTT